ncbi:MAG: glycosyltransferase family 4 protein [Verrucomicrobia bacterium]|jgi:glycosyltransferase involved in cell wall biosynthesis|nr:glycosyltransferase family 4 protein [Verrucomicrobiota bacterium]
MRIAILSLHVGAMAHYASSLAQALREKHQVACFYPYGVAAEHLATADEAYTYPIPQWATPQELLGYLRTPAIIHGLKRDIHRWQPDVLHVNSGHILYGLFLKSLAQRYPVVSTIHDIDPHLGERRPFEHLKQAPLLNHSRIIAVHSEGLRQMAITKWSLPPEQVSVFPMAFNDVFSAWRSNTPREPKTILLYGRLRGYKGIQVTLDAMSTVLERRPDTKLIIAGQGDLAPYAKSIEGLQNNIEIINRFVSDAETATLFERCSIALVPYIEASQSSIPFVAASFGRPVIASRIGAIPEVVQHGETGLLVAPGDTSELAGAITGLLEDTALQDQLGQNAKRFINEQFGPKTICKHLEAIYAEAIARW